MSDVKAGSFSDICYNSMWRYFTNHDTEVGSQFRGDRNNRALTNCVIYVYNVLEEGYAGIKRLDIVKRLKDMFPRQDGMELSKYLVSLDWKAHYWNPDVYKPRDHLGEHTVSFLNALKTGQYYGVNLSGLIVGYNKQEKSKIEFRGFGWPIVSTEDPENVTVFKNLQSVKFCVGINKGGTHCFLMSNGQVLEVHWDQEGPNLYGKTDFYGYEWNSGIILTPPDSSFTSRSIADIKAKTK